jgi:hypothetical protein
MRQAWARASSLSQTSGGLARNSSVLCWCCSSCAIHDGVGDTGAALKEPSQLAAHLSWPMT